MNTPKPSSLLGHNTKMRRISRIERPLGLLKKQKSIRTPSPYFCSVCKHQINLFSTSPIQAIPADEKIPFTEKVRQKIWGTDQPPGLDDPYGGTSIFDKTKRARNQEPPEEVEEMEDSVDNYTQQYYKPATTWEGLLWIGGGMVWQPGDKFEGFLPENEVKGQERIVAALHRAVVEIFSLQQAGKSLREVSTHFPKSNPFLDWTDDVQITPSPGGATVHMPEHISLQQAMKSFAAPEMSEEMNEFEPTESQEDIDADRSEVDPMKLGVTPSTEPTVEPAEQIKPEKKAVLQVREPRLELEVKTYEEVISFWDPSWLEISLEDPEVKFAVSLLHLGR
jgi:hypothetical protein